MLRGHTKGSFLDLQAGDAVWEAEGVLPLVAMLDSKDPEQFKAAASAMAELANPENKAFQVGGHHSYSSRLFGLFREHT